MHYSEISEHQGERKGKKNHLSGKKHHSLFFSFNFIFEILIQWQHFFLAFTLSQPSYLLFPTLLQSHGLFFFLIVIIYAQVQWIYIHVPRCNLVTPCNVTCRHTLRRGLFGNGQSIVTFFPLEDHLFCCNLLIFLGVTSKPHGSSSRLWHVHWCHPSSAHVSEVMLWDMNVAPNATS